MLSGKWSGLLSILALAAAGPQGGKGDDTGSAPMQQKPRGLKLAPCPSTMVCKPKSSTCTDLSRCQGICVPKTTSPQCGGIEGRLGDKTSEGGDDPRIPGDGCEPGEDADRIGICL